MAERKAVRRKVDKRKLLSKRQRPNRNRAASPDLVILKEAQSLLTPFLTETFQMIYEVAKDELGASIKSATVSIWSHPGESDSTILPMTIIANVDKMELKRVMDLILHAIAEKSVTWTAEERETYSHKVYFDLEPLYV